MAEKIRYLINSELKRKQFSDNALNDTEKFQLPKIIHFHSLLCISTFLATSTNISKPF